MTDPVKEQLSACLDGELPEAELDLLLKQVSRHRELGATAGRYALIGETLRSPGTVAAPADFAQRIAAAIEAEPALGGSTAPSFKARPWLRPLTGVAVAAGVAAVALLSLQPPTKSPGPTYIADAVPVAPVTEPEAGDPAASYIVPANTTASGYVPARLTNYVVAHSEYSMPLGRRSVLTGVLTEEEEVVDTSATAAPAQTDSQPQAQDDASQP